MNGPVPTGCAVDCLAVRLDHLARDGADRSRVGDVLDEARARLLELELHRVAVERAQALDLAVVVERLRLLQRCVAQLLQAEDTPLLDADHAGLLFAGSAKRLNA